jgi:amino-acid N-acetyltransferase
MSQLVDRPTFTVRPARTPDVPTIARIVSGFADNRILLHKETVNDYQNVQEFQVAVDESDQVIGCGAVHVMWEDLAEIRTLAVDESWHGRGVGHALLAELLAQGERLGVSRLFCLTFEVDFFTRHGFHEIEGTPVQPEVYAELLRSGDEGVAEFLDLARVKPNTLGNTRMLRHL